MKKGLVEVTKEGEVAEVHPTTVEDHLRVGWKLVDPADRAELAKIGLISSPAGNMTGKLVKMFNGKTGETLEVHPSTVAAHIRAGWNVVDPDYLKAAAVETAVKTPEAEKAVVAHSKKSG